MELIDYDIRERKSLAVASRYRKNGSKSKKCSLPSDSLSEAKIKKMNGEVKVYQIGKPISYQEFKEYPAEMQKEYLRHFAEKHGCSRSMVAEMMGVRGETLSVYLCEHGLGGILKRKPTDDAAKKFSDWLRGDDNDAPIPDPVVEEKPQKEEPTMPYFPETMRRGSLHLEGSASEILQTLFGIFRNTELVVDFEFSVKEVEQIANLQG